MGLLQVVQQHDDHNRTPTTSINNTVEAISSGSLTRAPPARKRHSVSAALLGNVLVLCVAWPHLLALGGLVLERGVHHLDAGIGQRLLLEVARLGVLRRLHARLRSIEQPSHSY